MLVLINQSINQSIFRVA